MPISCCEQGKVIITSLFCGNLLSIRAWMGEEETNCVFSRFYYRSLVKSVGLFIIGKLSQSFLIQCRILFMALICCFLAFTGVRIAQECAGMEIMPSVWFNRDHEHWIKHKNILHFNLITNLNWHLEKNREKYSVKLQNRNHKELK